MTAHLPALQVVITLLAAPACILVRGRDLAFWLALLTTWAAFAVSCLLLDQVMTSGIVSYELGGWAAPFGIEYRVDALNAFVLLIVSGIGAIVLPFTPRSLLIEMVGEKAYLFYCAFLLCVTGLLGVTITGDAFNLFVFMEISSLASCILISLGPHRRALTAAFQYLIVGTIGATFIVIGIGLIYGATGTLNLNDIAERLPATGYNRTVIAAFAFLIVGAAIKLALFPLHFWLPRAYTYAPSTVSAFLAATATKVGVYVLIRFLFTVFGVKFSFDILPTALPLMVLAVLAMFVASTVAIFQDSVKRMLAYSSVAQIGYMVLGLSLVTVEGLTASIVHLFNHALMKGALFLAIGCIAYRQSSFRIEDLAGMGKRMPWTMAAFTAGGLSLIGIPLTAGFISKWYLILAALAADEPLIAALIVISSLLAVIYVWRVVEAAYFREAPPGAPSGEAPLALLIPTWALIALNVYFGIETSLPVGVSEHAARALMGAGP
ncbi:MAG: monovalent cation/H+ antiporter subunit D family protein [Defluviicoccus sp.]|nr:monovalent cation/H+ antiporter subunit D family protein [Defluviicoccus sp.]